MKRLYVVVRADLAPGLQLAQACHATREFGLRFPGEDVGDNLVVLHARDEAELHRIAESAGAVCAVAEFREPDIGNQFTAIAFGVAARKLVSSLPLALRAA